MGNTNSLPMKRLYRAFIGGLLGTMLGISVGLATVHAASQPADPAPASVVVQVQP